MFNRHLVYDAMLETATNETKQKDIVKKFRLTTHNLESIKKIAKSYWIRNNRFLCLAI